MDDQSATIRRRRYYNICKNQDKSIAKKADQSKKISNSREQLPNTSLSASTPARLVAIQKAPTSAMGVAAIKASPNQEHSMSAADIDESNNIAAYNNSSSNSSKNNSSNIGNKTHFKYEGTDSKPQSLIQLATD